MTSKYNDLKEFAEGCVESYEKYSILREISTVEDYRPEEHQEKEFIGIGKRINLPKRFFSDPATITDALETDVGRAVFKGERNFILQRIRNRAVHGQLEDYSIDKFNYESLSDLLQGKEFTDIFLPFREEDDGTSSEWLHKSSDIYFTGDKMYIDRSIEDVRIHILPRDTELGSNRAFALNRNEIKIVQKRKQIDDNPKGIELIDKFRDIGAGEYLMLYFGNHPDSSDEFDFLYRVLLSEPEISAEGAAAIHIPISEPSYTTDSA